MTFVATWDKFMNLLRFDPRPIRHPIGQLELRDELVRSWETTRLPLNDWMDPMQEICP
jgi:hypothetical protein